MAVTANQLIRCSEAGDRVKLPVAAITTLYQGTIAFIQRTSGSDEGHGTGLDNNGANDFAGIVIEKADNSAGAAGDVAAEVYQKGAFVLPGTGFTQSLVGDMAYATDNYTVTADSTNAERIGTFVEYISTTLMKVRISPQRF